MSERIPLLVVDGLGGTPTFVTYKDKTGAVLTPPLITPVVDNLFGFTIPDADMAAGVVYLVATDGTPAYFSGSSYQASQPFDALLLVDGVAGSLWAGGPPVVGACATFAGSSRSAPSLVAVDGAYLYALVPSADNIIDGVAYRVDAPVGAMPSFSFGAFGLTSAVVGDLLGDLVSSALTGDPTVASLVSTRIYPNLRPQSAPFPLVVYSIISEVPENALAELAETRLKHSRLQIDCYSKTYREAHRVALAVESVIANLSAPGFAGWKDIERDLYDNEAQLHRVSTDFMVSR